MPSQEKRQKIWAELIVEDVIIDKFQMIDKAMTIRIILIAIGVVLAAIYQYEGIKEDKGWTDNPLWFIVVKRVSIFLAASIIWSLLILSAGGDSTPSWVPERKIETGRGQ